MPFYDFTCENLISKPPLITEPQVGGDVYSTNWYHYCGKQLKENGDSKLIEECPSKKEGCPHYQKE